MNSDKKSLFQLKHQPIITDLSFSRPPITTDKLHIDISISGNSNKIDNENEGVVTLDIKLESEKNELFTLMAKINANFVWEAKATEEEIQVFLNSVAPSIMLSYMRPIISNITTYAGLPPYIMPFLDLRP